MDIRRRLMGITLGVTVLLHGLGHAVLPMRAADVVAPGVLAPTMTALYVLAMIRSTISNDRIPASASAVNLVAFELPHFIMQRKMMLTIKALAERDAASGAARMVRQQRAAVAGQ